MNTQRNWTDEDLTAYLDEEMVQVDRALLDTDLEMDAALRARLETLRIPVAALAEAFEAMLPQAPDAPDLGALGEPVGGKLGQRFAGLAAALVIGIAVGGIMRPGSSEPEDRGWMAYVAAYQALYVTETLASVDVSAADESLSNVSSVLGVDLKEAGSVEGLQFVRAQVLGFEGRNLVQLAYLTPEGNPVALCLIASEKEGRSKPLARDLEGLRASSWHADGFEYLLIGGDDEDLIQNAALDVSARL